MSKSFEDVKNTVIGEFEVLSGEVGTDQEQSHLQGGIEVLRQIIDITHFKAFLRFIGSPNGPLQKNTLTEVQRVRRCAEEALDGEQQM